MSDNNQSTAAPEESIYTPDPRSFRQMIMEETSRFFLALKNSPAPDPHVEKIRIFITGMNGFIFGAMNSMNNVGLERIVAHPFLCSWNVFSGGMLSEICAKFIYDVTGFHIINMMLLVANIGTCLQIYNANK